MSNYNHYFHLVNYSSWPLLGSLGSCFFLISMIKLFHMNNNKLLMLISTIIIILIMYQWWRDIIRESTFQGFHTKKVIKGMKWGMILFITSEILFFFSFFWTFFHSSLSPTIELGNIWPPIGINVFNPYEIPLLNTIILLSSGMTITWSHFLLMKNKINFKYLKLNNDKLIFQSLLLTIILGIYFTILQGYEYINASYSIADSVYGSIFFLATGFHGLHVLIGTKFLIVCLLRIYNNHFSNNHHFGFEAAAWYWHFVDVVWLFLYLSIYWWMN